MSLSTVAERAGVTRMTLYRHFGPRRELLLEVLLEDVAPVAENAGTLLSDRGRPLPERAHQAMCQTILALSATPLLSGVLGTGLGETLDEIDPSGAIAGQLTTAVHPFLVEAAESGTLRGTPDDALAWVIRQLLAGVVGRRSGADPQQVAHEVATYFLPSLFRVDDADLARLANTVISATPTPAPLA